MGQADNLQPQLVTEGAETWQAEGKDKAFVTLRATPNWALFLNPSQRHSASVFNTIFRPEQQEPAGFFSVLPLVTKDKQSAKLSIRLLQSAAGAGADWCAADSTAMKVKIQNETRHNRAVTELNPQAIFFSFFGCKSWWVVRKWERFRVDALWRNECQW